MNSVTCRVHFSQVRLGSVTSIFHSIFRGAVVCTKTPSIQYGNSRIKLSMGALTDWPSFTTASASFGSSARELIDSAIR